MNAILFIYVFRDDPELSALRPEEALPGLWCVITLQKCVRSGYFAAMTIIRDAPGNSSRVNLRLCSVSGRKNELENLPVQHLLTQALRAC
jgi:hypothetical protein